MIVFNIVAFSSDTNVYNQLTAKIMIVYSVIQTTRISEVLIGILSEDKTIQRYKSMISLKDGDDKNKFLGTRSS